MTAETQLQDGFVHGSTASGLIVSTCLYCAKVLGSPTAATLRLAERTHQCPARIYPSPRA